MIQLKTWRKQMPLTSVAAPIWNEIAETQKLKTAWAKKAFAMDGMEMAELEDREYKAAKSRFGQEVAASYVDLKPLLLENVAISKYTQAHPNYRPALPEIVSIAEAVIVASQERPLNPMQQKQLAKLLQNSLS